MIDEKCRKRGSRREMLEGRGQSGEEDVGFGRDWKDRGCEQANWVKWSKKELKRPPAGAERLGRREGRPAK